MPVALHDHEGVAQIYGVIGAKPEFPAGFQFCVDEIKRTIVHHPALHMPRFGPRIGMQQIDEGERLVGHAAQYFQRVAHMQTHIAQRAFTHMRQRLRDSVHERFAAYKSVVG